MGQVTQRVLLIWALYFGALFVVLAAPVIVGIPLPWAVALPLGGAIGIAIKDFADIVMRATAPQEGT